MADTSFTDISKGINALLTPLASVGTTVFAGQTMNQINSDRIKAGKQPCTGQWGQPADCPAIFAPASPPPNNGGGGGGGGTSEKGMPTGLIVALVGGVALVLVLLLTKKKPVAARRKSRKSRR